MSFRHLDEFPEFKRLQDDHEVIRGEMSRIGRWVHNWGSDDPDGRGHCRFQSGEWTVFPVYVGSNTRWESFIDAPKVNPFLIDSVIARLPQTFPRLTLLLRRIQRIKWVGFSRLGPKSELKPHSHSNPTSLIYHLGLVIPPDGQAGLMAGEQTHVWEKAGEAVIFDDNYLHAAWNHADSERIVLYINFARDLTAPSQ